MLAQLPLASRKDLVMPFEHANPGMRGRTPGIDLGKKLWHGIVRDTDVIGVTEIVLQPFQLFYKLWQDILIEQAAE